MIETLKFVQGAVAKKDYVPVLTHFRIQNGTILGFNGSIAISSPIGLDITCSPKAVSFVKAIQTCKDTIQLNLTSNGRLTVRSGGFRANVECIEDTDFPDVHPTGKIFKLDGNLIGNLEDLYPFIAEDASRAWARGIRLFEQSGFATNNIIVSQKWLGYLFPVEVNIPESVITELIRVREEPSELQIDDRSITFHFSSGRWIRSQLLTTQWPNVSSILDKESNQNDIPQGFFQALKELYPFVDDLFRIHLLEDRLSTSREENVGASIEVPGLPEAGCYNIKQLLNLEGIARTIDFGAYPNPCLFYGEKLRGAIVGMRI